MLANLLNRYPFVRRKKIPSPYAGYSERMMASAIDLFCALIILRPIFNMLDRLISPHVQRAVAEGNVDGVLEQARGQDAFTQFSLLIDAIFSSDVWWWVAINHGSAFLLLAATLMAVQFFCRTTLGKWVMGIKLTTTDQMTSPSLARIIVRYLACALSCGFFMLGLVWVMFDKKSRAWHDIAAGTVVMNMRPQGWYWTRVKRGYHWVRVKLGGTPKPEAPSTADEAVAQPPAGER